MNGHELMVRSCFAQTSHSGDSSRNSEVIERYKRQAANDAAYKNTVSGAGNDQFNGDTGANYLDGEDGNDILNSGGPGSSLFGGAGDVMAIRMRWREAANDNEYTTQQTRSVA